VVGARLPHALVTVRSDGSGTGRWTAGADTTTPVHHTTVQTLTCVELYPCDWLKSLSLWTKKETGMHMNSSKENQLAVSTAQHSNVRAVPNPSEKHARTARRRTSGRRAAVHSTPRAAGLASSRSAPRTRQTRRRPPARPVSPASATETARAPTRPPPLRTAHARDPSRRPSVNCSCSHLASASTAEQRGAAGRLS
jgi:hypothetical protein